MRFLILLLVLISGCAQDPFAECKPLSTPNLVSCSAYDGIVTTDLEDGHFEREPTCRFSFDGNAGRIDFDEQFCRTRLVGDTTGERIKYVNVRCVVPELGSWTFTDASGSNVLVERTDAGHVCTR